MTTRTINNETERGYEEVEKFFKSGVLIRMSTRGLCGVTGRRKAAIAIHDDDGNELPKEFYTANRKKLESSDPLKKVTNLVGKMKNVIISSGMEYSKEFGLYMIAPHKFADTMRKLRELRERLRTAWETFCNDHYDSAVENAREKLGERFRERDYPSVEALIVGFDVSFRVVRLSIPDELRDLDMTSYREAVDQMRSEVVEFQEFSRHALRDELQETLTRLVNALNPGAVDGRKGRLSKHVLEKFNQFYERVKDLAFCSDENADAYFCPKRCEISEPIPVDNELAPEELPVCPVCGEQLALPTVTNYAYRIRRAMEGIGVPVDDVKEGTAALREMQIRVLLHDRFEKLSTEAEQTMELQSSRRFIKRRKARSSTEE